jgi:hypothetical protein
MPWIRIDEHAINHPKFRALSDGAFRLWVEGMAYCQVNLTDGFIPDAALKQFRYYSPKRRAMLTTVLIPGKGPMWHDHEAGGIWVHDYLDWNECRDQVIHQRQQAKQRMQSLRESVRPNNTRTFAVRSANVLQRTNTEVRDPHHTTPRRSKEQNDLGPKEPASQTSAEEGKQIHAVLKGFCELYAKHRAGARYTVKSHKHVPLVRGLLKTHSVERLLRLAAVFQRVTHDEFITQSDYGIEVFSAKINWLEARLSEAEAQQNRVG